MALKLALAPVQLPVVFRSGTITKTFNRQPDGRGGEGDSIGVWKDGSQAWKLFPSRTNLQRITTFYTTAGAANLPMGNPVFREGTVQRGTGAATKGFALVTRWLDGRDFNFQNPGKSLRVALTHQNISHSKSSRQYKRIYAGCMSAKTVGLRDVQGFVNGNQQASEPLAFFDVHTSASSEQAVQLVEVITAWGTKP